MFDRRFGIFVTVRQFLSTVGSTPTIDAVGFLQKTNQANFLFHPCTGIDTFIDEVYSKARKLEGINEMLGRAVVPNQQQLQQEQFALLEWLSDAHAIANQKFMPQLYLYDEPGKYRRRWRCTKI